MLVSGSAFHLTNPFCMPPQARRGCVFAIACVVFPSIALCQKHICAKQILHGEIVAPIGAKIADICAQQLLCSSNQETFSTTSMYWGCHHYCTMSWG